MSGLTSLFLFASGTRPAAAGQDAVLSTDALDPNPVVASGQSSSSHDHAHGGNMGGWSLGLDGAAFATFNRQGGRRGENQFNSQNWIMTMATRRLGRSVLTLSGGFSAEPLTVDNPGYSEIFQEGEAYNRLQITDHQHPHDLFMQLAAAWRVPLGSHAGFTLAGGPVGEPALGPVAFIHRASSSENPVAPLSHHIFDSTHISAGVVTMGLDGGPFAIEGSVFRGREPDQNRYDIDFGPLDSWSMRMWVRPGAGWLIQGSHGHLHEPEELEPGDQRRNNVSVSWFRQRGSNFTAATAAVGRNTRRFSTVNALLLELTQQAGRTSVYGRFEALAVETEILLFPEIVHRPHYGELVDPVRELTLGVVRDVAQAGGLRLGIGGDVVLYAVPKTLEPTHDLHPVSCHVFVRVIPGGARMWNMTMGDSTTGRQGMMHGPP